MKRSGMTASPAQRAKGKGPGARRSGGLSRQPYKAKTCPTCGASFLPWSGNQKYCGVTCAQRVALEERTCEACGETYWRNGPKTRFCSLECWHSVRLPMALCAHCGTEYKKRKWNQKYCSPACGSRSHAKRGGHKRPRGWSLKRKGEDACRSCGARATHLHHIVPRSKSKMGYEDVAGNGLPLCVKCHFGWHSREVTIYRSALTTAEYEAGVLLVGAWWMEKNYPPPPDVELVECYALAHPDRLSDGWQERQRERGEFFDEQAAA